MKKSLIFSVSAAALILSSTFFSCGNLDSGLTDDSEPDASAVEAAGVACDWYTSTTSAKGYFTYSLNDSDEIDGVTGDTSTPKVVITKTESGMVTLTAPQIKYNSKTIKAFDVTDVAVSSGGGAYYLTKEDFDSTAAGKSDTENWTIKGKSVSGELKNKVLTVKIVYSLEGSKDTLTVNFTSGKKAASTEETTTTTTTTPTDTSTPTAETTSTDTSSSGSTPAATETSGTGTDNTDNEAASQDQTTGTDETAGSTEDNTPSETVTEPSDGTSDETGNTETEGNTTDENNGDTENSGGNTGSEGAADSGNTEITGGSTGTVTDGTEGNEETDELGSDADDETGNTEEEQEDDGTSGDNTGSEGTENENGDDDDDDDLGGLEPVFTTADYASGSYTGNYKGTVKVGFISGSGSGTYSHIITKTGDSQVSLTMPEIKASVAGISYTMKSFTITDITVSTEDDVTYTLTATKTTFATDEKNMTISSFTGYVKDGVLKLNIVYKYGSMPANMTYVFPN